MHIFSVRGAVVAVLFFVGLAASACESDHAEPISESGRFSHIVVDSRGPADPWGKSVGDVNGDGLPDLIVGGHGSDRSGLADRVLNRLGVGRSGEKTFGQLVWYENPTWRKHVISNEDRFVTDHEVVDVDRDGRGDVVSITASGLAWYRNPDWSRTTIDVRDLHDVEVADFDGDGDIDIVARNQSRFGHTDGNRLHFYRQEAPDRWVHFSFEIPHGEGLKVADVDGDGRPDVVVNGFWCRNPGHLKNAKGWAAQPYGRNWQWPDVYVDVADINGDGRPDIVLAPAEAAGSRYRISWFEQPTGKDTDWREHVIDPDVEAVHHFIAAGDLNNDGTVDVVTAKMHQGDPPREIAVYWNRGSGRKWEKETLATSGSHCMRVADIDADGDLDLFGANWSGPNQAVELWVNQTCPKTWHRWKRHVIDERRPWRALFLFAADLDADGFEDVVTGGWWYRNPGRNGGKWDRRTIGEDANNVVSVRDFDGDGSPDILASQWKAPREWTLPERALKKLNIRKYPPGGGFVWGRNDGGGRFEIHRNVPSGEGDFLQGVTVAAFTRGVVEIALSWHTEGQGIQMLRVPDRPIHQPWTWRRISTLSQDEAVSAADIDGDGDIDLVLGTMWMRNEGNDRWTPFVLHPTDESPDRNRVADLNGDGIPDVVVGYEAISAPGKIAWYERGSDPARPWTEHLIGRAIGPMSLDVADMDGDGDLDVIVGEHNLENPGAARLLVYENLDGVGRTWREHVIYVGDEHHDGALVVDIDNDGDLDILSIGWGHDRVVLYENLNPTGRCPKPRP